MHDEVGKTIISYTMNYNKLTITHERMFTLTISMLNCKRCNAIYEKKDQNKPQQLHHTHTHTHTHTNTHTHTHTQARI